MKAAGDDDDPFVLTNVRDGFGRAHDVYVEPRDGEVVLYCPTAFWSMTLTPAQGHLLAPAVRVASDRAQQQAPR